MEKLKILYLMLAPIYRHWLKEVWNSDLDERFCCDDPDCGCGGATVRDIYLSSYDKV